MDQWQGYPDAAGGSQRRYNGNTQMTPGREYGPQSPAGVRYDQYGNVAQNTATSPMTTPQLRDGNGDIPMADAHDAYGGMKYPMRPHHQSHVSGGRPAAMNLHSGEPSAAAQRYSPMEVLSPTSPYQPKSAGPGQQNQFASPHTSQRQSPTRNDYPSSPYYGRQGSSQLPPITPYGAGGQDTFPSSTVAALDGTFANDPKSPRRAMPPAAMAEKRPVPEFKKTRVLTDLRPQVNTQPAFRRANPEGGFISV